MQSQAVEQQMPDFVIVGGGIYGCAVAWGLAGRGADVCLLEASEIASGASGGLGKRGVRANGRDVRELPLMKMAHQIWPTLDELLDASTGFDRIGHLMLLERDEDLPRASVRAGLQARYGIPSSVLDASEVRQKEPGVDGRILAALFCPDDGIADHTATTKAFASAGQRLGVDIRERTRVVDLETTQERVTGVVTDRDERISVAREVVVVTNHHVLPLLERLAQVSLPAWPVYPQVLLSEPIDVPPVRHLIGHAHRRLAIKSVDDKRVMISGGWRGKWNRSSGTAETDAEQVAGNREAAIAVFPELANVPISAAAVDRGELMMIDQIPVIDRLPGCNNLLFAAGWSGHGWAIAPAVCQLLAEWMMTSQRPKLLEPFRLSRFDCR